MVTMYHLVNETKNKIEELKKLRVEVTQEKELRERDEADLWMNTDFKAKKLTSDKLRAQYVKQQLSMYPNRYLEKKDQLNSLETEINFNMKLMDIMKPFGVLNFEELKPSGDKESGSVDNE